MHSPLLRLGTIGLSAALLCLLCLFFIPSSTLCIKNCKIAAPYLDIRSDRLGRIASAPRESAAVGERELLFSFVTEEERIRQQQLQEACSLAEQKLQLAKARSEQAMHDYLVATATRGQVVEAFAQYREEQALAEEAARESETLGKDLERLRLALREKEVLAPFSGMVVKQARYPGECVQPGDLLCSLCNPARSWIEAVVPEQEIAKVALGQKAKIRFPSGAKQQGGRIDWISPAALPTGEGVPIRIALDQTGVPFVIPHLSADVTIYLH